MDTEASDILATLSDAELVLWWGLAGDYPGRDVRQRARLGLAVAAVLAEAGPQYLSESERPGAVPEWARREVA